MLATAAAVIVLAQTPAPTVSLRWNQELLDAITAEQPGPPMAARALAVVHTATYDAWSAYDDQAVPAYAQERRIPRARRNEDAKAAAVSAAAYAALSDLFPNRRSHFQDVLAQMPHHPEGSLIGRTAAREVLAHFANDGSNQRGGYADTTGYASANTSTEVKDPNRWQPLEFVETDGRRHVPEFIGPHWGSVTPFSIPNVAAMRPPEPVPFGTARFAEQAQEIVDLTAELSEKQKVIAEYWADGPDSVLPPGHWAKFAGYVSQRDSHTLDQDIKMFFLMGSAMHDAAVCCWDAKRHYDYVRPITAIRIIYADQEIIGWRGPGKGFGPIKGQDWIPYQPSWFITPPFPEYTSGHSTFSSAGAEILLRYTGSDEFGDRVTFAAGSLRTEPGVAPDRQITLSWPTFSAAAEEAGMSRRWGGIHFEDGDIEGRKAGRKIGEMVWNKAQRLFRGLR